ncbi:sushi domain-containing protein 4-like [Periplaneta americana]|uniref:sushi domain-containing protein 4-like n=1 Tax=Periplaneta americana TaxID=6978 RepID=UPI0037E94FF4
MTYSRLKMKYFELLCLIFVVVRKLNASELFAKNRSEVIPIGGCPEFGDIGKGATTQVIVVGDKQALHIECLPGYDLIGPPKILCVDGEWEHIQKPQCSKRCPSPPFLRNAEVRLEGMQDSEKTYRRGSRATYSCGEGFRLSPPSSKLRTCKDGYWSGPQGRCVANGCQMPPDILYGYYVLESTREEDTAGRVGVGQRAHYNCNLGYTLTGPASLQCLDSGDWSPRLPPHCTLTNTELEEEAVAEEAHCPPLPATPHTRAATLRGHQNANSAAPGTEVELRCEPGYRDPRLPCQPAVLRCEQAAWQTVQGVVPECLPVEGCVTPPTIEHGALFGMATDGRYRVHAEVAYTCQPGYTLSGDPVLTCAPSGCWEPSDLPECRREQTPPSQDYKKYWTTHGGENKEQTLGAPGLEDTVTLLVSLVTALGVMLILLGVCLVVVCRRRRHRGAPPSPPRASAPPLIYDPDRVALIADGAQLGESSLPSYEEAVRERCSGGVGPSPGGLLPHRSHRGPHWSALGSGGRRARGDAHVTRQSSSTSHTASLRSGSAAGDSMGSTDTMTPSEVSTNVTLDTVSSHTCSSGSQTASCRAICGSLASFDTSSVHNTEGVPLLEESEHEDGVQGPDPTRLVVVDQSLTDSASCKCRRTSPDLA